MRPDDHHINVASPERSKEGGKKDRKRERGRKRRFRRGDDWMRGRDREDGESWKEEEKGGERL